MVILVALGLLAGCGDDGPSVMSSSVTEDAGSSGGSLDGSSSASTPTSGSEGGATTAGVDTTAGPGTEGEGSTTEGEGSSTGAEDACEAPARVTPCDAPSDAPDPFQALGLGCPAAPDEAIPLVASTFQSADPDAWQLATQLGTHVDEAGAPTWGPTHGEQLLVISSGVVAAPDDAGRIVTDTLDDDANDNPDDKPLPAPMVPTQGSSGVPFMGCDGVGDCSDSLWLPWQTGGSAANDLLWFQLRTEVPGGTHGFALDFAFFSEEFPESVGTTFNDMFVVWSSSETYVGNLCFIDEQPCTVTSLWPIAFEGFAPELQGTGFAEHAAGEGGGTGWFQLKGSAAPHEVLELTFAVFDMGDDVADTLVLLDGFAWDCQGCTPTPEDPCGVVEPR